MSAFADMFGEVGDRQGQLQRAMTAIGEAGSGVVVILRDPRPDAISANMKARGLGETTDLRDYGVGAQILVDLGVSDMVLLTNSHRNIVGLQGYGLNVVSEQPIAD